MSAINTFLVKHHLRIAQNPCVSPDFCLDWPALAKRLLRGEPVSAWPKSRFETAGGAWWLLEDAASGDCAWQFKPGSPGTATPGLEEGRTLPDGSRAFP
ncbi:MAG: hypothetical protein ACHQ5A_10830, partial [Opitutales bacterium]